MPREGHTASSLGAWIRLRRRALGLTQAELAARVPCAVITVRKLESDERRPSPLVAERLADALELDGESTERFTIAARTAFSPSVSVHEAMGGDSRRSVPATTSPLVGRADAVDEVFARLAPAGGSARLLTITGPPGVGKTRLALEVADRVDRKLELHVAWVELVGVADANLLPAAIARAVTPPGLQGAMLTDIAVTLLQRSSYVVFLDNCEHLSAGVDHVSSLLEACPSLCIVATSRTRLDLHGEHEFRVDPLASVSEGGGPGAGIVLFVDRAREVGRPPEVTDPVVRSIVERVEGFPLAIELAALRLRDFDLVSLDASLRASLEPLAANRRGVPVHHSSLDAAVAWSVRLLSSVEREALESLAVFPRGATATAVAEVADLPLAAVVEALRSLVDAALVARRVEATGGEALHAPFVIVKEHVLRSGDPTRLAELRRRFAGSVLREAEARLPGIDAWPEPVHMAALDDLDDSLQSALAISFGSGGDADVGVRLALRAVSGWIFRGRGHECGRWVEAALAARPGSYIARYLDAVLTWWSGGTGAADAMELALAGALADGNTHWVAECAGMAQLIALSEGDDRRATELASRAIEAGELAGGEWRALVHLRNGQLARRRGDVQAAVEHAQRCTDAYEEIGSTWGRGVAAVLAGSIATDTGRHLEAAEAYLAAIERFGSIGLSDHVASAIADCGHLLFEAGRADLAAVLYGMVEGWLADLGVDLPPASRHRWREGRHRARGLLGDGFDVAAARGGSMMRDLESVRSVISEANLAREC